MKHTWKRFLGVTLALVLLLGGLTMGGSADELVAVSAEQLATRNKPELADKLQFNDDGTFKIIQVSDLQEFFLTSTMTKDYLRWLAKTEKPDLFVLTGDNISDGGIGLQSADRSLVTRSINSFMSVFEDIGVPVTMVLGNHDTESSGVTRWQQMQTYQDYDCFVGFSASSPNADDTADSRYWGTHNLLLKDSKGEEDVFALWMFDSGDYVVEKKTETLINSALKDREDLEDKEKEVKFTTENKYYSCVGTQQVNWFKNNNAKSLPGLAFQHIIVKDIHDYLDAETKTKTVEVQKREGDVLFFEEDAVTPVMIDVEESYQVYSLPEKDGYSGQMNEQPCPGEYNNGQFAAMKGTGVMAIFSGHDHTNTFEIVTGDDTPMLVNSPCSGFGSYGRIDLRGVRVIELDEDDLESFDTRLVTYQDYANAGGAITKTLQTWRLAMMNNGGKGGTGWTVLDWITFKPLTWFLGLFGL